VGVWLALALGAWVLQGCANTLYDRTYTADGAFSSRIRTIVLHYTQVDDARSLELLASKEYPVSSHYLISSNHPESGVKIYNLVEESERAWHAGVSAWKGRTNINDTSIGIEIVYTVACSDSSASTYETCVFPDYDQSQIEALIELLEDITNTYPDIEPLQIVAHSDIAPHRKMDPGPMFPWHYLYQRGFGAWYDTVTFQRYLTRIKSGMFPAEHIVPALEDIGYHIPSEDDLEVVVKAFQARFVPHRITGELDALTVAAIFALREKYVSGSESHIAFCEEFQFCKVATG